MSTSCASILSAAYGPNLAAFSNPDEMLSPSAMLGGALRYGPGRTSLDAIFAKGVLNPGVPLPPKASEFAVGSVSYKQSEFCGSVDVSMYRMHDRFFLPLAVVPTLCPIFVQPKSTIAAVRIDRDVMDTRLVGEGASSVVVSDADRDGAADGVLAGEGITADDETSWLLESVDTYACLSYVVGSRQLVHDTYNHNSNPAYHIYVEMARLSVIRPSGIDSFPVGAFAAPTLREGRDIVFTVNEQVDLAVQIGDTVAFYDGAARTLFRGEVVHNERVPGRGLSRTIRFATQEIKRTFKPIFDRNPLPCYMLVGIQMGEEASSGAMSDVDLLGLIDRYEAVDDVRFQAVPLGVLGETQPEQVLLGSGAVMVATVLEGTSGLVVDDRFYVTSYLRSKWHFGDKIFIVMRDTESTTPDDDDAEYSERELDAQRRAYLPSHMVRYELTYYNGRDITVLRQMLAKHDNRHLHFYAYIGQFRQTRSDPFFACCDISLAAIIESKVRILYTPRQESTPPSPGADTPFDSAPMDVEPAPPSDAGSGSGSGFGSGFGSVASSGPAELGVRPKAKAKAKAKWGKTRNDYGDDEEEESIADAIQRFRASQSL